MEEHFEQTHYLCPEPYCWAANYVVFKTSDELMLHHLTVHQQRKYEDAATHLVGFGKFKQESKEIVFKDKIGYDYSWWFGDEYAVNKKKEKGKRKYNEKEETKESEMKPEELIEMCYEYLKKFIKLKLDKEGVSNKFKVCKT